jgi:hypothetical protein
MSPVPNASTENKQPFFQGLSNLPSGALDEATPLAWPAAIADSWRSILPATS